MTPAEREAWARISDRPRIVNDAVVAAIERAKQRVCIVQTWKGEPFTTWLQSASPGPAILAEELGMPYFIAVRPVREIARLLPAIESVIGQPLDTNEVYRLVIEPAAPAEGFHFVHCSFVVRVDVVDIGSESPLRFVRACGWISLPEIAG